MSMGEKKLISHNDLPLWANDNEFIVSGYRAPGGVNEEIRLKKRGNQGHAAEKTMKTPRKRKSQSAISAKTINEPELYEHDTFYRCWRSIWLYIHNESVNIHTHFWGALVAISAMALHILAAFDLVPTTLRPITHHSLFYSKAIVALPRQPIKSSWFPFLATDPAPVSVPVRIGTLVYTPALNITPWLLPQHRPNDWKDIVGFTSFLIGAVTVLTCSATFHTVVCHSKEVAHFCNKLDYIGIVAMIVGSFLPMLHYGFYCHSHLQALYSTLILSLGSMAMYTVLNRKFASPAYRPIRTSVFLALGLSAIFPVAHVLSMYGYEAVSNTMGIQYLIAGGALYVIGACLYMARIPERFSPGTFDYFGASHQIFHILILLAALSHYICIRRSYTFWHTVEAVDGGAICHAFESLRHGH